MSSRPFQVSVGTKSSKFTLIKRDISKAKSKNISGHPYKNIVLNYPSDFAKYKQQKPSSNQKKLEIINPHSSHYSHLNSSKNKIPKKLNKTSKKDFVTLNNDFLQFFKQLDIIKKSAVSTNRTYYDPYSDFNTTNLIRTIYASSVSNSKRKNNKETYFKKENNKNKPNQSSSIKITVNSSLASKKAPKDKKNQKKTFNPFKPFHIQFSKPLNVPHKNNYNKTTKYKEPIHSKQPIEYQIKNQQNKTQEISNKSNLHCTNNNSTNLIKLSEKRAITNEDKNKFEDELFEDHYSSDDEDEEEDTSGVLAYDEVKDIIIYYDFSDIKSNESNLFYSNDYEEYQKEEKDFYLQYFGFNTKNNETKSPSTNASSKTKTNYVPVIKVHK